MPLNVAIAVGEMHRGARNGRDNSRVVRFRNLKLASPSPSKGVGQD